jgi:hypothetical protein
VPVTKRKATEPVKESPKKKSRPSAVEERKSTGGKSLPKKSIPVPSGGKVKSVEIIESESESEEEEEDDDFAALLGAEMAKNDDEDEGEEIVQEEVVDYEDSTSGEEDDDFQL